MTRPYESPTARIPGSPVRRPFLCSVPLPIRQLKPMPYPCWGPSQSHHRDMHSPPFGRLPARGWGEMRPGSGLPVRTHSTLIQRQSAEHGAYKALVASTVAHGHSTRTWSPAVDGTQNPYPCPSRRRYIYPLCRLNRASHVRPCCPLPPVLTRLALLPASMHRENAAHSPTPMLLGKLHEKH